MRLRRLLSPNNLRVSAKGKPACFPERARRSPDEHAFEDPRRSPSGAPPRPRRTSALTLRRQRFLPATSTNEEGQAEAVGAVNTHEHGDDEALISSSPGTIHEAINERQRSVTTFIRVVEDNTEICRFGISASANAPRSFRRLQAAVASWAGLTTAPMCCRADGVLRVREARLTGRSPPAPSAGFAAGWSGHAAVRAIPALAQCADRETPSWLSASKRDLCFVPKSRLP